MEFPREFTVWEVNECIMGQRGPWEYGNEQAARGQARRLTEGKRAFLRSEVHDWRGVKLATYRQGQEV